MNPSFAWLRMGLSALRLLPHLVIMLGMIDNAVIRSDLLGWAAGLNLAPPRALADRLLLFVKLMTFTPEYRNLWYLRVGLASWPIMWLCPRLASLRIDSGEIGPGFFIQHGENTFISADRIGANCWVGRHIVVGYANATDRPTIGNNVKIFAGAKIIGKVRIGDNATIGLNTVILDNVEPGATMLGVPGRVVWRDKPPAA